VIRLPERKRKGALKGSLIWKAIGRQKSWVIVFGAGSVFGTIFTLSIAAVTANLVDVAIVDQAQPIAPFVERGLILAGIAALIGILNRQCISRLGYHIEFDLRTRLYVAVQTASLSRMDRIATGELVTRALTDLMLLDQLLRVVPYIVLVLPFLGGLGLYVFLLNPLMAMLAMLTLPINIGLIWVFRKRLFALSWAELRERSAVTSAIGEPVRGMRVVQAFGREQHERDKVGSFARRTYGFALSRARLLAFYDFFLKFVPVTLNVVLLIVGGLLTIDGSLTLGTFLVSFQLGAFILNVAQLFDEWASQWQYLRTSQGRLTQVLDMGESAARAGAMLPLGRTTGLRMDRVSLDLGAARVVDDLEMAVGPGELVVLTGPPRSGKTSVAMLAAGLLPPTVGSVTLDGVPLSGLDADEAWREIRLCAEDPFLFATTLRANLELGSEGGASDEAIAEALRLAGAEDVVDEIPGGLDGDVGDRGLTLSGGQRQRVALARALVEPPRLLVLDDALAAVNPALEVEILRRLRRALPEVAILCITRRPGPATIADRVVTLLDPAEATHTSVDAPAAEVPTVPAGGLETQAEIERLVRNLNPDAEQPHIDEAETELDSFPTTSALFRPFRGLIALAIVILIAQTIMRLSPQILFGDVADLVEEENRDAVLKLGALLMVFAIGGAFAAYWFRVLSQKFTQGLVYLLRRRLFRRLSRLGIDFYDRELPGQVAARVVHDLDVALSFYSSPAFLLLTSLAQMLVAMTVIVIIAPGVAWLVGALLVVLVVVTAIQYPINMRAFEAARTELGNVTSKFEEDFAGRREIRAFGALAKQTQQFVTASARLRRARRSATTIANVYAELMNFLAQVTALLVLWRSGNLVLAGTISVGSALTLRLLASTATQPIQNFGPLYTQLLDLRVSMGRLAQLYTIPILPEEREDCEPCPPLSGAVEFDDVVFSYPGTGREILHGVSFSIEPGSLVALVGYTGAGKSSIAKLLLRTYDPGAGTLRVDGHDLRDLGLASYRRRLSVVPQDPFVFRGTVASNIAYGRPEATREDVEAAAQAVGAHEALAALSGGYDHPVEEEGRNLTAAQRQLVAIARAWLAEPDVLVLDEATSSLDLRHEALLLDAVRERGRTALMITHRDTAAERADFIIVLDAGAVVEMGPPAEVIGSGGAYDRLWDLEPAAAVADDDALTVAGGSDDDPTS
jgi:ATP-binding cassette subfamily B protein